jgi:hypothetical protein
MYKLTEEDYYRAWRIYNGSAFVDIDKPNHDWCVPKYNKNPEQILLEKEAYEQLSAEAKMVINMVVNPSFEMLRECSTKTGMLTECSIRKGLTRILSSKLITKYVIEEIRRWVHQLY